MPVSFERMMACAKFAGSLGTCTLRVSRIHLLRPIQGLLLPQVLATPVMILIMRTPRLRDPAVLDAGESAVGTANRCRILPPPRRHEVRAEAEGRQC